MRTTALLHALLNWIEVRKNIATRTAPRRPNWSPLKSSHAHTHARASASVERRGLRRKEGLQRAHALNHPRTHAHVPTHPYIYTRKRPFNHRYARQRLHKCRRRDRSPFCQQLFRHMRIQAEKYKNYRVTRHDMTSEPEAAQDTANTHAHAHAQVPLWRG